MEPALLMVISAATGALLVFGALRFTARRRPEAAIAPSTGDSEARGDRLTVLRARVADLEVDQQRLDQKLDETNESLRRTMNKMNSRARVQKGGDDEDDDFDLEALAPYLLGAQGGAPRAPQAPQPNHAPQAPEQPPDLGMIDWD